MWNEQARHDPDLDTVFGAGQIARERGLNLEKALLDWVQTDDRPQRIVVAAMLLHPYWAEGEWIEVRLAERLLEALETRLWEAADEEIIAAALAQGFGRIEDEGLRARVRGKVAELASRGHIGSALFSLARRQVLGK